MSLAGSYGYVKHWIALEVTVTENICAQGPCDHFSESAACPISAMGTLKKGRVCVSVQRAPFSGTTPGSKCEHGLKSLFWYSIKRYVHIVFAWLKLPEPNFSILSCIYANADVVLAVLKERCLVPPLGCHFSNTYVRFFREYGARLSCC